MKQLLPIMGAVALLLALPIARVSASGNNPPYYSVTIVELEDGSSVENVVISGPPHPPPGYAEQRAPLTQADLTTLAGSKLLPVPAYDWSFGCSATSGAMIAAYYDRSGLPNIYTGQTNGGVMPLDNSAWGTWRDGNGDTYGQCPLTASRLALDGRSTRGSMDDYWIAYGSSASDPYLTYGWAQHAWGEAIGDYMRTSQSGFDNMDGATSFYNWTSSGDQLTCADMVARGLTRDGTYGRKLFYEAKGYTVTDCYNQKTDNNGGGFTFALYKAEINAGRPVMLNLAGHTVVGLGYDEAGSTVYIHDTWDYETHAMTWGGSYSGMTLKSVSVVNLICPAPSGADDLSIVKLDAAQVQLTWGTVLGADHYEIWSGINQPYFTAGADCQHATPFTCTSTTETSLVDPAPGDSNSQRTYVVRTVNACGGASAPAASPRIGEFVYDLQSGH